jgi:hypothetical protein
VDSGCQGKKQKVAIVKNERGTVTVGIIRRQGNRTTEI